MINGGKSENIKLTPYSLTMTNPPPPSLQPQYDQPLDQKAEGILWKNQTDVFLQCYICAASHSISCKIIAFEDKDFELNF